MADAVVRLEGLRKSYGIGTPVETEVLHGIDLSIARGEFCAMTGPSGSGKSTLLNIIGLLDRPTAGVLQVEGQDVSRLDDAALTRLRGHSIGFVFQYHHLIPAFTASENVMMPLLVRNGWPDEAMSDRANSLLDQVELGRWKHSMAMRLSGGQQQRVAIARSLAADPALILADEPTGNLDTRSADSVFELMRRFNRERGVTFLIVTHILRLADRCDRIVEIVDGQIAGRGAAANATP